MKNKYVAAGLAFGLGMFGVHKFYLNDKGSGIFYFVLFLMTNEFFPVSVILGIIDGMRYLTMGTEDFDRKFNSGYTGRLPRSKRTRKKRTKEHYDYQKPQKRTTQKSRKVRTNPFKKSGLKKYKDFDIEEAIIDFEKGLKIQPRDTFLHFNLACSYSLLENADKAFFHIGKAVEFGFADIKKIQEDDDLAYMRIQPEYDAFKSSGYKMAQKQEKGSEVNDELLLDKLKKLMEMRQRGIVTESDFRIEKEKILRNA